MPGMQLLTALLSIFHHYQENVSYPFHGSCSNNSVHHLRNLQVTFSEIRKHKNSIVCQSATADAHFLTALVSLVSTQADSLDQN